MALPSSAHLQDKVTRSLGSLENSTGRGRWHKSRCAYSYCASKSASIEQDRFHHV